MDHLCNLCLVFVMLSHLLCCLVATCWERADLLSLVCDVNCVFVTFQCRILGQVWYLIVSFPDRCVFLTLIAVSSSEIPAFEHLKYAGPQVSDHC